MPVDKFGRMDDVKTSSDGVTLAYISNNFLRKDGTTTVTGSINMNGNTLTRVSNPVNPQDAATKSYVDANSGLLDENGGYHMGGYLNMGFNKIKNIAEPEEPSEAATKKYVDSSGRAIVQQQDGTFSAVADINMRGYSLTNVIEPAEPQDVATKRYVDVANRAFVYGPGGYIAGGDVSMGGRRINNVGTPIEDQQVANKFYVDNVVEVATAGDMALTKNRYGTFLAAGKIDMNTHPITGLPNPTDRDAAANKNYVDNGGAIVKNPDGSFTAISNIDFQGFTIKNAATPVEERDLATKSYVDKKVSLPSIIGPKPIISMCAEEQGPLSNGSYEFSFGNGNTGRSHGIGGYCMAAPGRIIRGSLMVVKGNRFLHEEAKVNIVINGVEQVDYSIIKDAKENCSCAVFPQPLEIDQCDVINFITRSDNPDAKSSYVTILIELDL